MKTFIFFVSEMLSPALKNLSEEDSAGSDPESGLGLEPETDRFGFIVTSTSTAGWGASYYDDDDDDDIIIIIIILPVKI